MEKILDTVIVSVSDKRNMKELMEGLFEINPEVEVISSGGTASRIKELGYEVTEVSSYTNFPEAPGGLVKTLHPKVHGGILLDGEREEERKYLEDNEISSFNLAVINLYPFEESVENNDSEEEIVENIDIGGPTLIRSAAKGALRHGKIAPVIQPSDYGTVIEEMSENDGELKDKTITLLAHKAFEHTWKYDENIRNWTAELMEGY